MTEPKKRGRPPLPEGAQKVNLNTRVDAQLKKDAYEVAEARHESLGHAIEAFLKRYVRNHRRRNP